MAKKAPQKKEKEKTYPSSFGSHAEMVDNDLTTILNDSKRVVCVDRDGPYVTNKNWLDNGCADVNRHNSPSARKAGQAAQEQLKNS